MRGLLTIECSLCEKMFAATKQLDEHMREHMSVAGEESGNNGRAMPSSDHLA